MDSRRLSADQVQKLSAQLQRQSDYLHRLVHRMCDLNWRTEDPLWKAANEAAFAVDHLLRVAVVQRRPGGRLP